MADASDFDDLLTRARSGDESAMAALVEQYEPEVRMVARMRLGAALRPHLDSVDLVQSVHKSLMLGLRADRFDISTPEKLIALALTIVRRKVSRQWRKLKRQQRLSGGGSESQDLPGLIASLSASSSDPAEIASLRETTSHILSRMDDTETRVIELRLEGYTTAEVARQLGLDADVLRVKLSRLRRLLRERGVMNELL
jgi:RNA polymerase sigma factor (sigma-70 family)